MPKTKPSQSLDRRIGFETSFGQDDRIKAAAARKKISVAEWLRQAAESQLRRQKL